MLEKLTLGEDDDRIAIRKFIFIVLKRDDNDVER